MSSNGNDSLTSSSNDIDPACKYYVYDFNEENIKEKNSSFRRKIKRNFRKIIFYRSQN